MPPDLIATAAAAPRVPWVPRVGNRFTNADRWSTASARRTSTNSNPRCLLHDLAPGTLILTRWLANFQNIFTRDCDTQAALVRCPPPYVTH